MHYRYRGLKIFTPRCSVSKIFSAGGLSNASYKLISGYMESTHTPNGWIYRTWDSKGNPIEGLGCPIGWHLMYSTCLVPDNNTLTSLGAKLHGSSLALQNTDIHVNAYGQETVQCLYEGDSVPTVAQQLVCVKFE